MPRYGCFEIRAGCSSCGESLPVNGPFRKVTCGSCFDEVSIPPDIIAGFLNDFEEEYEGFSRGQGSGGTLMSGSGTYKYGYWRLEPRCSECKKPLPDPPEDGNSRIDCAGCGRIYHLFPAQEWLLELVPSARLCYSTEMPGDSSGRDDLSMDEESLKPIVMTCPQCAGALTVSTASERVMECGYCGSEVYVPDAVWTRLHPVRKTEEWFVSFEGMNRKQLRAKRRIRDLEEEKAELKGWRVRTAPKRAALSFRFPLKLLALFLAIVVVFSIIIALKGYGEKEVERVLDQYGFIMVIPVAILLPVWFAVRMAFSGKLGRKKLCKQALARLAEKHSWKHVAAEYRSSMGYINETYRGRDIGIDPDDDYAIEVDINDSPFYLKTEPPGYPHDGVQRFSSGDPEFDSIFPLRYITPALARRMESSEEERKRILSPVQWFLDRWRDRLGRLKIDWSDVSAHLRPGHVDVMNSGKYLLPEDLEPLLEDLLVLAAGIDAVASGREPSLPEQNTASGSENDAALQVEERIEGSPDDNS